MLGAEVRTSVGGGFAGLGKYAVGPGWVGGGGRDSTKLNLLKRGSSMSMFDHKWPGNRPPLGCGLISASDLSVHPERCSVPGAAPASSSSCVCTS